MSEKYNKINLLRAYLILIVLTVSCSKYPGETFIVTKISFKHYSSDSLNYFPLSDRYPDGAGIYLFEMNAKQHLLTPLTGEFASARAPDISYDGKRMLFSARKGENEKWQIYEMNLGNLKTRKIISLPDNCTDPSYLPGNRIIFCRKMNGDSLRSVHSIFVCNLDGTELKRITYSPADYCSPVILADGRILTLHKTVYPEESNEFLFVMRPDGTKSELFFRQNDGNLISSRPRESADGKIYIAETDKKSGEDILASIDYNNPFTSGYAIAKREGFRFLSVFPVQKNILIVSALSRADKTSLVYEFELQKREQKKLLLRDTASVISEVILAKPHQRPRLLPSEVDIAVKTGLLLCQDINFTLQNPGPFDTTLRKAKRVEIQGIDSIFGIVSAEADGSVYIKIACNTPFRIRTVDINNNTINGFSDWIYLRPNERRGCVGCHENPELTPDNRVPLAVKKPPIVLPFKQEKIKEKIVDLE
ncbi:MAG: HzsA-related protein [Bacteroidales bacterium]